MPSSAFTMPPDGVSQPHAIPNDDDDEIDEVQWYTPAHAHQNKKGRLPKRITFGGVTFVVQSLIFLYFICVTKNLLILCHVTRFVSKNTVIFALPHPVYVAVLFFSRLWSYIL